MVCYLCFFNEGWKIKWFNILDTDQAYKHMKLLPNESVRLFL